MPLTESTLAYEAANRAFIVMLVVYAIMAVVAIPPRETCSRKRIPRRFYYYSARARTLARAFLHDIFIFAPTDFVFLPARFLSAGDASNLIGYRYISCAVILYLSFTERFLPGTIIEVTRCRFRCLDIVYNIIKVEERKLLGYY